MTSVRVWDLPTRLFHWALVVCVIGLVVTANIGGNAMNWHFRFGYCVLSLVMFRLVWGVIGGRWSRFSQFIYSPSILVRYLRGQGDLELSVGHSPTGALSVFALLAVLLAQVASGLFSDDEIAFAGPLTGKVSGDTVAWASQYHAEIGKLILIGLIALHLVAIVYYKAVKKTNLVRPMIDGDKPFTSPVQPSRDTWGTRGLALLVLSACGLIVYKLVAWGATPAF